MADKIIIKTSEESPGLGLFTSTEIVKRQNGRIWVESTPNLGSTSCFTLRYNK